MSTAVSETKNSARPIIELKGVGKAYRQAGRSVPILENLDLELAEGAFEALMGPSGSGKTTLLNLIAGLDRPTSGSAKVAGVELSALKDGELARFRSQTVGFIFQTYNLIPVLTAEENVALPLLLRGMGPAERTQRARTALQVVGLHDRGGHYPKQLSGGQEQRVAIARAIVSDPTILVADEPTGDLDRSSADEILVLLEKLNREFKKTIFVVTHDPQVAERAMVTRHLDKGALT